MNNSGDSARVAYPLFQEEDGGANPTSPLQLNIYKISIERAVELNKQWHSKLPHIGTSNILRNKHYICFGGEYCGRLFACAIWSSPVARKFNGKNYLELRRMAICNDAPKNTASRMISIMTKIIKKTMPEIVKLISYQDTEVHTGTIYKASGWINVCKSSVSSTGWENRKRRNKMQTTANKNRWEKNL